jgi:hypothetical protein
MSRFNRNWTEYSVGQTCCEKSQGKNAFLLSFLTFHMCAKSFSYDQPNGQFYLSPLFVPSFLANLPVGQLPGVGWKLVEKLKTLEGTPLPL